jgi:hypothetical protein
MSTPATAALSEAPATTTPPATTTTPATTTPNPNGFWNSWNLPDQKETREWVANKNYENPYVLAKTAHQLEREAATLRASKGYPVPGADGKVDPNADKAWRTAVGVPESPDKYDLPVPENNPYPQFKKYMAEELHKVGVPAAMAPALAKGYEAALSRMEAELREQENTQSKAALLEVEREWGPQYKERMAYAARGKAWLAQEAGGLNDVQLRVLEGVMGTSKFLTAMWKLGAGNKEASFAGGDDARFSGGTSEAQARLDQITADRAAGKISDFEWRTRYEKESVELINRLAQGAAPLQ